MSFPRTSQEVLHRIISRYDLIQQHVEEGYFDINQVSHQIKVKSFIDLQVWRSKYLSKLIGLAAHEEQTIRNWYACIHPEDRARFWNTYYSTIEGKRDKSAIQLEYRLKLPDNNFIWHRENIFILKDEVGAVTRIVGAIRPIPVAHGVSLSDRLYLSDFKKLDEGEYVKHVFEDIVYKSPHVKHLLKHAILVAKTDSNVLITGATGTGKELFAKAIHKTSNRNNRPLIKVNCASLPAHLIESELFGHEKGAFTGAYKDRLGKFELADMGTIFLDEVGELPISLQAKLLRVLQEGELPKIGASESKKIDVRVLAATNRNLEIEIDKGNFREDLYYRLNVFPIHILPLKERREDIEPLILHFIRKHAQRMNKSIEGIASKSLQLLRQYDFPGNIRELENIVIRSIVLAESNYLTINESFLRKSITSNHRFKTLKEAEKDHITRALELTWWKVSGKDGAAQLLNLKPTTLESKMKKLGIIRPATKS